MCRRDHLLTAVVTGLGVLVVLTCSGETRHEHGQRASRVSGSRILYADSALTPLSPVQAIQITVSSSAAYDSTNRHWTYTYAVTNEATSANSLDRFAVRPVQHILSVIAPPHWVGFIGSDDDSDAVVWSVKDLGPEPPGWGGMDLYLGPYHTRPGQSVSGFKIVAVQSPATVSFYAQAFDTLPTGGEDELPPPLTIVERGVTGG